MTYIRALFLADVPAQGRSRGEGDARLEDARPTALGGELDPRALMFHHDDRPRARRRAKRASSPRSGTVRRTQEDVPPPLRSSGSTPPGSGTCSPRAGSNHAGFGQGFGRIPKDSGNTYALGIETDHTTGEEWAPASGTRSSGASPRWPTR